MQGYTILILGLLATVSLCAKSDVTSDEMHLQEHMHSHDDTHGAVTTVDDVNHLTHKAKGKMKGKFKGKHGLKSAAFVLPHITACHSLTEGAACSFVGKYKEKIESTCHTCRKKQTLVCGTKKGKGKGKSKGKGDHKNAPEFRKGKPRGKAKKSGNAGHPAPVSAKMEGLSLFDAQDRTTHAATDRHHRHHHHHGHRRIMKLGLMGGALLGLLLVGYGFYRRRQVVSQDSSLVSSEPYVPLGAPLVGGVTKDDIEKAALPAEGPPQYTAVKQI